jgi:PEP-CTERM motif
MKKTLFATLLVLSTLVLAPKAHAGSLPASSCASDFSSCSIYENELFSLPFFAIAGDLILIDQWQGGAVSDVFRVFNDVVDTGGGTGLGGTVFLYSEDFGNLPDPSTYSVNAVFMNEAVGSGGGLIETDYLGNGTVYQLFSTDDGTPEPSTFALMGIGAAVVIWRKRRTPARLS